MTKALEQLEQAYLDASRAADEATIAFEDAEKDWDRLIVCKSEMRLYSAAQRLRDATTGPARLHRAVLNYRDAKRAYDESGTEKQEARARRKRGAAQRAMFDAEDKADRALEALQRAAGKLPLSP